MVGSEVTKKWDDYQEKIKKEEKESRSFKLEKGKSTSGCPFCSSNIAVLYRDSLFTVTEFTTPPMVTALRACCVPGTVLCS